MLRSSLLAVSSITVEGNNSLTKQQVCAIADIKEPINIFAVRTDYLQNRLQSDLRIEKASVRRNLSNTLTIEIKERRPLATLRSNYGYIDIAGDGTVMNAYKNIRQLNFPLLTGVTGYTVYVGDKIADENIVKTVSFMDELDQTSLQQISEINVTDTQNIVAYTTGGVKIKLGDLTNSQDKAKKVTVFLNDLKTINRSVDYIDFSYTSPVIKFKS